MRKTLSFKGNNLPYKFWMLQLPRFWLQISFGGALDIGVDEMERIDGMVIKGQIGK